MKNPSHGHKPMQSLDVTKDLTTILPLPAGEGRGEGESYEREYHAVHGELKVANPHSAFRNRK